MPGFPVLHYLPDLLKLMSTELVMPFNNLILLSFLLLPSVFPTIRVFSDALAVPIRWPKYWSFSFSISPSKVYSGLISSRIDWVWSPCSGRDPQESSPAQFKTRFVSKCKIIYLFEAGWFLGHSRNYPTFVGKLCLVVSQPALSFCD